MRTYSLFSGLFFLCSACEPADFSEGVGDGGMDLSLIGQDASSSVDAAHSFDASASLDAATSIDATIAQDGALADATIAPADLGADAWPITTAGDACGDDHAVISRVGTHVLSGRIEDFTDDERADDCDFSGPDAFFEFIAFDTGTYVIDTQDSEFDTMLDIHSAICTGTRVDCADNDGLDFQAAITFHARVGEHFFVFIDSNDTVLGPTGMFHVDISLTPDI